MGSLKAESHSFTDQVNQTTFTIELCRSGLVLKSRYRGEKDTSMTEKKLSKTAGQWRTETAEFMVEHLSSWA